MQGESLLPLTSRAGPKAEDRRRCMPRARIRVARSAGVRSIVVARRSISLRPRAEARALRRGRRSGGDAEPRREPRPRWPTAWTAELAQFLGRSATRCELARRASIRRSPSGSPRSATSAGRRARRGPTGIDPKDRIAIANTLHEAIVAVEDGAFARAIPLLEKVIAGEPDIPIAQLQPRRGARAAEAVRAGDRAAASAR